MKPQLVHIATLCHSDDCCPELYFDMGAPADSCIIVQDDFGNDASFGPETVITTPLKPVMNGPVPHGIHGPFDEWIYMTPDQHHMLFAGPVLQQIAEIADHHDIDLASIVAELQQLEPSMRFMFR